MESRLAQLATKREVKLGEEMLKAIIEARFLNACKESAKGIATLLKLNFANEKGIEELSGLRKVLEDSEKKREYESGRMRKEMIQQFSLTAASLQGVPGAIQTGVREKFAEHEALHKALKLDYDRLAETVRALAEKLEAGAREDATKRLGEQNARLRVEVDKRIGDLEAKMGAQAERVDKRLAEVDGKIAVNTKQDHHLPDVEGKLHSLDHTVKELSKKLESSFSTLNNKEEAKKPAALEIKALPIEKDLLALRVNYEKTCDEISALRTKQLETDVQIKTLADSLDRTRGTSERIASFLQECKINVGKAREEIAGKFEGLAKELAENQRNLMDRLVSLPAAGAQSEVQEFARKPAVEAERESVPAQKDSPLINVLPSIMRKRLSAPEVWGMQDIVATRASVGAMSPNKANIRRMERIVCDAEFIPDKDWQSIAQSDAEELNAVSNMILGSPTKQGANDAFCDVTGDSKAKVQDDKYLDKELDDFVHESMTKGRESSPAKSDKDNLFTVGQPASPKEEENKASNLFSGNWSPPHDQDQSQEEEEEVKINLEEKAESRDMGSSGPSSYADAESGSFHSAASVEAYYVSCRANRNLPPLPTGECKKEEKKAWEQSNVVQLSPGGGCLNVGINPSPSLQA